MNPNYRRASLLLILILCHALMGSLSAQELDVSFDLSNFMGREVEWKPAMKAFLKGSHELERTNADHRYALSRLIEAQQFNPSYSVLNKRIGLCYLELGKPDSALIFLTRSLELSPEQDPAIHLHMGRAYHLSVNPELAIRKYNDYLNQLPGASLETDSAMVNRYIRQVNTMRALLADDTRTYLEILPPPVNSERDEYLAFTDGAESLLLFSSDRHMKHGAPDIVYELNLEDVQHPVLRPASRKLRSKRADNTVLFMDASGKSMLGKPGAKSARWFTRDPEAGEWMITPVSLAGVELPDGTSSLTMNADTSIIAICAPAGGREADRDIFLFFREGGSWTGPVHGGGTINSASDESTVAFHPSEDRLYFTSGRAGGAGGYDIFSSDRNDNAWSRPLNLGFPVNSPSDEVSISFSGNGSTAYISSDRPGRLGGFDIYRVTFMGDEKRLILLSMEPAMKGFPLRGLEHLASPPAILEPDHRYLQEVTVSFMDTIHKGLRAFVLVSDLPKHLTYKVPARAPQLTLDLPAGRKYTLFFNSPVSFSSPWQLDVPETIGDDTIRLSCQLLPLVNGKTIVFSGLDFFPDSDVLLPESEAVAGLLAEFLKSSPGFGFEIRSHADSKANTDPGRAMEVTSLRASRLATLMVERYGITPAQLKSNGYGYDLPPMQGFPTERIELRCLGQIE